VLSRALIARKQSAYSFQRTSLWLCSLARDAMCAVPDPSHPQCKVERVNCCQISGSLAQPDARIKSEIAGKTNGWLVAVKAWEGSVPCHVVSILLLVPCDILYRLVPCDILYLFIPCDILYLLIPCDILYLLIPCDILYLLIPCDILYRLVPCDILYRCFALGWALRGAV